MGRVSGKGLGLMGLVSGGLNAGGRAREFDVGYGGLGARVREFWG